MPQKAYLHVDFEQPETLVFNRARMRRAFVSIGQVHMRDARRLVMKRGRSDPAIILHTERENWHAPSGITFRGHPVAVPIDGENCP